MPTVAAEIHQAVICHAPLGEQEEEVGRELLELLGSLGTLVELADDSIDAATAIMGCTPAYVALIVESLTAAVSSEGLDHDLTPPARRRHLRQHRRAASRRLAAAGPKRGRLARRQHRGRA